MSPREIYNGSDGEATKALYTRLQQLGPKGLLAVALMRACKCSERAKVYRGGVRGQGSYRGMAYDRKQWSMLRACEVLIAHAPALGIRWGWKDDPAQAFHNTVLYVELPTGQVSFHTDRRGEGPDFAGEWDQVRNASADRIILFVESVLAGAESEKGQVSA